MADKAPTKTEILGLVQAQSETTQDISERLVRIEKLVDKQESRNDKQESRNQGALYAVILGFFFIVVAVAVEIIISNRQDNSVYNGINSEITETQNRVSDIQNQMDVLKAKNSYLR